MKIFILTEFKIPELEKDKEMAIGDHICEDLIDVLKHDSTCVIDGNERSATAKFEKHENLHYIYEMDLVRRLA